MKRFLAVYILFAIGIAAYAWQTMPAQPHIIVRRGSPLTLDDYAWLLSVTVLKALPALLTVLLCAYIAARIWTHLRYAAPDSAGRLPIPRSELSGVATEALAAYHTVELKRARLHLPQPGIRHAEARV